MIIDLRNTDKEEVKEFLLNSFIEYTNTLNKNIDIDKYVNIIDIILTDKVLYRLNIYTDLDKIHFRQKDGIIYDIDLFNFEVTEDTDIIELLHMHMDLRIVCGGFIIKDDVLYLLANCIDKDDVDRIIDVNNLSFGKELVGLDFNPSGNELVNKIKTLAAEMADIIYDEFQTCEKGRFHGALFNHTINEILNAQMNAVKFLTLNNK